MQRDVKIWKVTAQIVKDTIHTQSSNISYLSWGLFMDRNFGTFTLKIIIPEFPFKLVKFPPISGEAEPLTPLDIFQYY